MEEQLEAVLEVGEVGAGGCDVPGVLAEVPPYKLSEELVKVDLTDSLHSAEWEGGGAAVRGLGVNLEGGNELNGKYVSYSRLTCVSLATPSIRAFSKSILSG